MKIILSLVLVFSCVFFSGCNKDSATSTSPVPTGTCRLLSESTNLSGNSASYAYNYSADGNLSSIRRNFLGIPDSTAVFYDHVVIYTPSNSSNSFNNYAIAYNANLYTGQPTTGDASITIDGVEQRHYWAYAFAYDTKNRLIKVTEATPTVPNDYEYILEIAYNDKDNVTALTYKSSTGPNTSYTIPADGYDDKPSPYAGIKNWVFMMRSGFNGSDPEPIFTALSKNNLLGYTITGWKRTSSYTYDDKGNPTTRTNTNTTVSGSYTFQENYGFQCN
jgi:YD repeat-containing protein